MIRSAGYRVPCCLLERKGIYEKKENETTSTLSDQISKDLKKKGMSFVGSITIYSYLEAIGIYNHHDRNCFLHL